MSRKYLYSNENFNEKSLPSTRRGVFKDVLKLHYFSLIKIGLVMFLFAAPLLVTSFFLDYSFIIAHETGASNSYTIIICSVIEILCLLFLAIPVSGLGKVFREYCWLEPVFFVDDFKKGIKDNLKPTLISLLLIGILNLIFNMVFYFSQSGWLVAIPFGFNVAVLFPILLHTIFINFTYTNKYFVNFKLGCYFYFKHLPSSLLSVLLLIGIKVYDLFMLANVLAILTKYLIILIFFIFLLPMIVLGIQLNELRIFDKHINSVRFPHLVNKGLHIETEPNNEGKANEE